MGKHYFAQGALVTLGIASATILTVAVVAPQVANSALKQNAAGSRAEIKKLEQENYELKQPVGVVPAKDRVDVMALNALNEASPDGDYSKNLQSIINATYNLALYEGWTDKLRNGVYAVNRGGSAKYSWTQDTPHKTIDWWKEKNPAALSKARALAQRQLKGLLPDITGGGHFYARTDWIRTRREGAVFHANLLKEKRAVVSAEIGEHTFLRMNH